VAGSLGRVGLVIAVAVLSAGRTTAGESTCVVKYEHDRLTVHVDAAPLADVVREIGTQSGAEIVGAVCKPREVTQAFHGVPIADGLMRLLGDQSFTLRYGPRGELRQIDLRGESLAPTAASAPGDGASERERPRLVLGGHGPGPGALISHEVTSDGQVVVSVREVGPRGGRHPRKGHEDPEEAPQDPAVVGTPVAQGTMGAQGPSTSDQSSQDQQLTGDDLERKLRSNVLNNLEQMADGDLAQYLATPEGQRVAALLQYYAAHHPSSSANQRANGLLDRVPDMRTPAPRAHH